MRKQQRKLERYVEGLEQQTDCLQEHNTILINENRTLKEENEKNVKFMKGLEWEIEAICGYLEKQQDKNEKDK